MENSNSNGVVTYNGLINGQNFLSKENQVNIINRNSDLKNGYKDENFECNSEVNLCCIPVKNSEIVSGGKVLDSVEPKYVSIIDINSTTDLIYAENSRCLSSGYTNGNCESSGLKIEHVTEVNGFPSLGTRESEGFLDTECLLGDTNGLTSKGTGDYLQQNNFLSAESESQSANLISCKRNSDIGAELCSNGVNNLDVGAGTRGSEKDLGCSRYIRCTELGHVLDSSLNSRVSEDLPGKIKTEIGVDDFVLRHQKLQHTSSGSTDEDVSVNGRHLLATMSSSIHQKSANHMNSLGSSSGYDTDPNVSIVDVSTGPDEKMMNPSSASVNAGSAYEVETEDRMNNGGLKIADDDDVDDSSKCSRHSLGNSDDVSHKSNGHSLGDDAAEEPDDVSKSNGHSVVDYVDDDGDDVTDDTSKSRGNSSRSDEVSKQDSSRSDVAPKKNGHSLEEEEEDDDVLSQSKEGHSTGNTNNSASAKSDDFDVVEAPSDGFANGNVNDATNSAIGGSGNSGVVANGVVDHNDSDDGSYLDGYSSCDDDDVVDGKRLNQDEDQDDEDHHSPKKPHLQRRRSNAGASDYWNEDAEDGCIVEFLDKSNDCAEARLAAKRQARAEAREIRMRELERQQREAEETADKVYDIYSTPDAVQRSSRVAAAIATPRSASVGVGVRAERDNIIRERDNNSYHSSRRSSEDSLEEATSLRDMRHELKEVEDKFRKAMIANAQLDNEKAAAAYQVELLKDRLEEMDENHSQLHREHRDKCRQFEALKRAAAKLQEDLEFTRVQLEERDRLIEEQGLVIVGGEYSSSGEDEDQQNDADHKRNKSSQSVPMKMPKRALVSSQVAEVLEKVGSGSLDVRLKKFVEQRNELLDELNRCKLELEEERARSRSGGRRLANGPLAAAGGVAAILDGSCATLLPDDVEEVQREANKLISDYKFRLQKADQDNSTLQATVARLESQVVRYKTAAEIAEKVEDDLKAEKRKLQREYRESQARVEELETAHSHLQKRLDKLKNAKSALLKEL